MKKLLLLFVFLLCVNSYASNEKPIDFDKHKDVPIVKKEILKKTDCLNVTDLDFVKESRSKISINLFLNKEVRKTIINLSNSVKLPDKRIVLRYNKITIPKFIKKKDFLNSTSGGIPASFIWA